TFFGFTFYRPLRDQAVSARQLLAFAARGCGRDLRTIVWLGLMAGLLGTAGPIATGVIFDSVIPGAQRRELLQLAAALFISALGPAMFQLTRNIAVRRIQGRMTVAVQSGVWDRLLSLPVSFFRQFSSGDLASRAIGIDEIRQVLTGTVLSAVVSAAG